MVFACDHCHYLFSLEKEPEQCPDCGKYRVRPATEEEQREFDVRIAEQNRENGCSSFLTAPILLRRETNGSAGGGAPQKSFSFKDRAKRAANGKLSGAKGCR